MPGKAYVRPTYTTTSPLSAQQPATTSSNSGPTVAPSGRVRGDERRELEALRRKPAAQQVAWLTEARNAALLCGVALIVHRLTNAAAATLSTLAVLIAA
ncbi:hypothetical protein [Streptomyces fradiae]|uniref:hypothetical protein n=1 Tax=Streptomyces fradiae TaxID=1906 RepID=UPI00367E2B5D